MGVYTISFFDKARKMH